MNTEVMFSKKSDMWSTPQSFFDKMNEEFNFTLDVCAIEENAKCQRFFSPEDDGLSKEWSGICWCNPPYSDTASWTRKCVTEAYRGVTTVLLIPARTDTKYFQNDILRYSILNKDKDEYAIETELRFLPGRLKFGNEKNSAPFPSVAVVFKRKNSHKPLVVLKDWMFIANGKKVQGIAVEHHKDEVVGEEVESGIIVKKEGDMVETKNCRYKLI